MYCIVLYRIDKIIVFGELSGEKNIYINMLLIANQSKDKLFWPIRYKTYDGAFWPIQCSMHFLQVRVKFCAFCLR